MSNEEEVELMMTDDNKSPNSQNSNRRDPAPSQLNSSRRRQLLNPNSNMTKSFPEASSSRVNVVHNKLNSTEDRKNVTTKSNMDISLSSPEECTDNRTLNNQPLNKFKTYRKCNNVDDAMDTIDDDDDDEDETKVMNKFEDSDDDNNVEVDDGMFRVAGFIDDKSEELEVDVNILRTICKNNRQKRPFVDLYTIPSQTHDTKDITMLLLESYNNWWRGYKAKNTFEPPQQQKPTVEPASASPKQTFANRMKGNNAVKSPQQNEIVQLIDVNSSSPLGENRGDGEEVLNNSTANIRSPVSEKEELFFNKAQDFPDLYSRTTAIAKELRSPTASSYNNRSRTNQTSAATSRSSNIELEIATDERWDPNSGSWTNTNRKGKQRQANNDLNKPNNDQSKADEKVQCPICQLSFSVNKVEDHAAQCFQFPMETRSNNQDTNKSLNISRDAPEQAALNNSVDLTESDDEEWEQVRTKANKRKGCSDEDDLNGTDNVKRACRKIQ